MYPTDKRKNMKNPLSANYSEERNLALVRKALDGESAALDKLVRLHQPFIYNVAWKMVHDPNDAMDLTQEVMIKVITKLAQFNFKSAFRTWLYRIVVNEFLQGKRRKSETQFTSFEEYGERLDAVPNPDLNIEEEIVFAELSKEMQIRCMSGMIMCLNREQRLIYVLGDSFGIDHNIGAEIFGISRQNFRIKLHRARKDLYSYMNDKCGLVNKNNPCRCPKKAKALKKMGFLDEQKMEFNIETKTRVSDYVEENYNEAREEIAEQYTALFRAHPAREDFDEKSVITEILDKDNLLRHFELD